MCSSAVKREPRKVKVRKEGAQAREGGVEAEGERAERKRSQVGGRGTSQTNSHAAGGSGAEGSGERPPVEKGY